jgi:hypothetical protein
VKRDFSAEGDDICHFGVTQDVSGGPFVFPHRIARRIKPLEIVGLRF